MGLLFHRFNGFCAAMQKLLEASDESDDLSEDSADTKPKECLETQSGTVLTDISKSMLKDSLR